MWGCVPSTLIIKQCPLCKEYAFPFLVFDKFFKRFTVVIIKLLRLLHDLVFMLILIWVFLILEYLNIGWSMYVLWFYWVRGYISCSVCFLDIPHFISSVEWIRFQGRLHVCLFVLHWISNTFPLLFLPWNNG